MSSPAAVTGEHPPNRLAKETSPYLLQHAHNPVDWWAWGDEAFEEARRRDVPIFLSIGYSTCYWCHVMERESFESVEIAQLMNERFVCIKVDREERPDVDDIYMAATVTMTGQGGWPMSVFLEPKALKPFWCGTYFPAQSMVGMGGRPTFPQVLTVISDAWRQQRSAVAEQAAQLAAGVQEQIANRSGGVEIGHEQIAGAVQALLRIFDRTNGGFGGAPKFPQPVFLEFLLDARRVVDADTRTAIDAAIRHTLDRMACGGVRDQVGGGFHRYSVDATWTVPHFEKMLYDNAQLAAVYAAASIAFKDGYYEAIARSTLDYVLCEMTSTEGAFFSAQDAEVDSREGQNYIWTLEQLRAVLPEEDVAFALDVYRVASGPNFQDPHHPHEPPVNVLRLEDRPDRVCQHLRIDAPTFNACLSRVNEVLYAARSKRKQPRLDDKVLASWNGLMIGAMAKAGALLRDHSYIEAAERAAKFILSKMSSLDGRLKRSWRAGETRTDGVLEDYASVLNGLMALHGTASELGRAEITDAARRIAQIVQSDFTDEFGGLYDTRLGRSDLFVRPRSTHDGAVPSATSMMIHGLIDLAEVTGEASFRDRAVAALASVSANLTESPVGMINATRALLRLIGTGVQQDGVIGRGATSEDQSSQGPRFTPAEFYASVDRITVGKDQPAALRVLIKIAEGYHVIAADPGPHAPQGLVPFRVHVVGGSGVTAYAEYPAGEEHGSPATGRVNIYKGTFEMQVVLEMIGAWKGRPLVGVTYQACSDSECLKPMKVEIDVAIDNA